MKTKLGLSQLREREKVLVFGGPGTSKTYSIASLALSMPERRVVVIDPDDGFAKVVRELGGAEKFGNVDYIPVHTWEDVHEAYTQVKEELKEGDWLCVEQAGRLWDMAQNYYSAIAYSETAIEHLVGKIEAEGRKGAQFGGFEGGSEWPVIKRLHNEFVVDDMVTRRDFNVFMTAAVKELTALDQKSAEKSQMMKDFLAIFAPVGAKPEGEKHNIYRFDTIAYLVVREAMGSSGKRVRSYYARVLRDRGRTVTQANEMDITDSGFWAEYKLFL